MKNRKQGFTLVEIMIVVMIIGLLAAIALPGFARARATAQANACINNMRQIESAKDQYAVERGLATATVVTDDMATDIADFIKGGMPVCPVKDGSGDDVDYNLRSIGINTTCGNQDANRFGAGTPQHVLPGGTTGT